MAGILIAFASTEGHTAALARHIAGQVTAAGRSAILHDVKAAADPPAEDFNAAILAGPLHYGRHAGALRRFAKAHAAALNAKPTLFLSVNLSAAGDDPKDLSGARQAIEDFKAATGLNPWRAEMIAGGVHLTQTPWLQRLLLKWILKRKGVPIPADGEIDFTDWPALDALVEDFLAETSAA